MKWLVQLLGFQQRRYISTRTSIKKKKSGDFYTLLFFYDDSGDAVVSANDSDNFVSLVTV